MTQVSLVRIQVIEGDEGTPLSAVGRASRQQVGQRDLSPGRRDGAPESPEAPASRRGRRDEFGRRPRSVEEGIRIENEAFRQRSQRERVREARQSRIEERRTVAASRKAAFKLGISPFMQAASEVAGPFAAAGSVKGGLDAARSGSLMAPTLGLAAATGQNFGAGSTVRTSADVVQQGASNMWADVREVVEQLASWAQVLGASLGLTTPPTLFSALMRISSKGPQGDDSAAISKFPQALKKEESKLIESIRAREAAIVTENVQRNLRGG